MIPKDQMMALRMAGVTPMQLQAIKRVLGVTDKELTAATVKEIQVMWTAIWLVPSLFERAGTTHMVRYASMRKILDTIPKL